MDWNCLNGVLVEARGFGVAMSMKENIDFGRHDFEYLAEKAAKQKHRRKQYTWRRQPWSWKDLVGRILPWHPAEGSHKVRFGHKSFGILKIKEIEGSPVGQRRVFVALLMPAAL
jgi:hypothetical protein